MTTPFGMDDNAVVRGTELRLDVLIKGLTTAAANGTLTTLTVNGVAMPVADVIKQAQEVVKPWKDSRDAHATIRATSQSRPRDEEVALGFLNDMKAGLVAGLGRENQKLTDFGFKPAKRRAEMTTEQKMIRAAKAKLTRELRHTMGSRQKAALKETETPSVTIGPNGVEVDPASSTPTPPAAPDNQPAKPDSSRRAV